jgi:hypothetical protein
MNRFEQPSELHQELNPVLWQDNELKQPVQVALLRIAKAYWKFLGIDTRLDDVLITGSQANYNYSKHSDIDLHLVVDYNNVECDMSVDELFKTKRDLWKAEHDIDIHGIPVEVYVEDLNRPAVSATYSIVKNTWIKQPKRVPISSDVDRIERLCLAWMILITARIATQELDQIKQVKDMLWAYRKQGLAIEGEMGAPNLVFKTLRNSGVTDMLLAAVRKLGDDELSLANLV